MSSLQTRLLDFHIGPLHLGAALRSSLKADVIDPVLIDSHFAAMDRRIGIILQVDTETPRKFRV